MATYPLRWVVGSGHRNSAGWTGMLFRWLHAHRISRICIIQCINMWACCNHCCSTSQDTCWENQSSAILELCEIIANQPLRTLSPIPPAALLQPSGPVTTLTTKPKRDTTISLILVWNFECSWLRGWAHLPPPSGGSMYDRVPGNIRFWQVVTTTLSYLSQSRSMDHVLQKCDVQIDHALLATYSLTTHSESHSIHDLWEGRVYRNMFISDPGVQGWERSSF